MPLILIESRGGLERLEGEVSDRGLKVVRHGGRAQPPGGQHRQQQPGGGLGVGVRPDAAANLAGTLPLLRYVTAVRPGRLSSLGKSRHSALKSLHGRSVS